MTSSTLHIYDRSQSESELGTTRRFFCRRRIMIGSVGIFLLVAIVTGTTIGVVVSQSGSSSDDDDIVKVNNRYAREAEPAFWHKLATDDLDQALREAHQKGVAKNVILFIGDGMGPTAVTAGRILAGQMQGGKGEDYSLTFDRFPHTGLSKTYSVDTQTTDSAASATAYLTGVKTNQGMLGVSATAKRGDCASTTGAEVDSILKWFHNDGRPTGLVTTTRVTHATPAATYCHSVDRNWETDSLIPEDQRQCEDISSQLITKAPYINVILGGGRKTFKPTSYTDPRQFTPRVNGTRQDGRDLIQEWLDEKARGNVTHSYVTDRTGLQNVPDTTQYLFGLFNPSHMQYEVDRDKNIEPSLTEMTRKAINILQANTKGSKGFFLLVEGGRIDHGQHANNPARALHEVVSFSEAVGAAVNMTDIEDTLIVVSADHSHVMSLAGYPKRGNPILGKASEKWLGLDNKPYTSIIYGTGPGYNSPRENLTNVNTEDKDYISQSAVPSESETHGGEDVAIYARGPHAFLYSGVHEQNYIPILMAYASCVGPYGGGEKTCAQNTQNIDN